MQRKKKGFIRKGFSGNLPSKNVQAVENAALSVKVAFAVSLHMALFLKSSGPRGLGLTAGGKGRGTEEAERSKQGPGLQHPAVHG